MAKKKDQKEKTTSQDKSLTMFDKAANNIFSLIDNSYNDKTILNAKDQKFRSILNRELEISKGVSQGSIVDFVTSVQVKNQKSQKTMRGQNNSPDTNEMFTQNINDIFGYFQDMYKNRFLEIDDLKFISKFIPALGEAVKTVLDSVVASDNVAEIVNRKLDLPVSVSDEDKTIILNEIKRNEKELSLLKKLKNVVYKKTLVTGNHYVYTRYADDILISSKSNFNWQELVNTLKGVLQPQFTIKDEKTRYGSTAGRNWNLGLMVNKDNQSVRARNG